VFFKFTLTDVVADNASAGFYVGPVTRRPAELDDVRLTGCVVRIEVRS
jgi:2-keto-4-pentenoate hydratase